MTASHTAHGLASLGRHGDSMLVHMNPTEVAGLQSLARANGTSLTINPDTGMPEAFSLKGLFKAALPMIAGFALGPGGFGLGQSIFGAGSFMGSALGSGLLVGGLTGLLTGDMRQGLMAGMGAYGGYGLSDTLSKLGTSAPVTSDVTTKALESSTGTNLVGGNPEGVSMFTQFPGKIAGTPSFATSDLALSNIPATGGQVGMANSFPAIMGGTAPITPVVSTPVASSSIFNPSGFQKSLEGVKSLGQEGGWERAKNILGTPGKAETLTGVTKDAAGNVIQSTYSPATAGTPLTNMQMVGKVGMVPAQLAYGAFKDDIFPKTGPYKGRQKRIQTGTDANGNPIYTYMDEAAYSPYETLNLNDPLRNYPDRKEAPALILPPTVIAKEGGMINSFAGGGSVPGTPILPFNGGVSSQYSAPDGTAAQNTRNDAFGLGRLSELASQQSNEQAKFLGYAMGGPVSFADGGDSNKETLGLPSLASDTNLVPITGSTAGDLAFANEIQDQAPELANIDLIAKVAANLKADPDYKPANPIEETIIKQIRGSDATPENNTTLPNLGISALSQPSTPSTPMTPSSSPLSALNPIYYAGRNNPRSYAQGGETSLNLDGIPALNLNTVGKPSETKQSKVSVTVGGVPLPSLATPSFLGMPGVPNATVGGVGMPGVLGDMGRMGAGLWASNPWGSSTPASAPAQPKSYALNLNTGKQEAQYARGGYLNGAGDGMSDSIPATIEGKQPARLADGEFVIPADVVSHLGNGSSKAGSKRLYAMLDRVRKARTGHTKQGKQINPNKFLLA